MKHSYDIIGDVHGQYDKLEALLLKLGYRKKAGAWRHPAGRSAIFLGDLVDRGPKQVEVLSAVRAMVDTGTARCILGNHEYNAIGYCYGWRERNAKNTKQHRDFLQQVGCDSAEHKAWVEWMIALPPFLELAGINLCHAHWKGSEIDVLRSGLNGGGAFSGEFMERSFRKEKKDDAGHVVEPASREYDAVEEVLKGPEVHLPAGISLRDEAGTERTNARLRWWYEGRPTWRNATVVLPRQEGQLPDTPLPAGITMGTDSAVPVMVGHYWLAGAPEITSPRAAVLDWGAAGKGPLVAYRWDGEAALVGSKLAAAGGTR